MADPAKRARNFQEVPDFAGLLAEYLWHEEDESQALGFKPFLWASSMSRVSS